MERDSVLTDEKTQDQKICNIIHPTIEEGIIKF